jgi:hypothetical protein
MVTTRPGGSRGSRPRSSIVPRRSRSRCSRPTVDGSRTGRMSRAAATKSTCGRLPIRTASGKSRPAAASTRPGRAPRVSCSTASTGKSGWRHTRVDGDSFRADTPRRLAETRFVQRAQNRMFDLHPNGDRFVLAAGADVAPGAGEHKAVFVFDFFNELRRLAPVTR